jgi:hypothetical protein
MKVYIGPHTRWVGPYQIADAVFFWLEKYPEDDKLWERWDYRLHERFGDWLAGGKEHDSWLTRMCSWIQSKKRRRVKIQIDRYDTWNMDSTLAYIILPMLRQLQATKHGSPLVDVEDVPEHLQPTEPAGPDNGYSDNTVHERWEWVMRELIWTFEQLHPDSDWESQYHTGEIDIAWGEPNDKGLVEMKKGPRDTHRFDADGYQKHQARITNGLKLFGKYYQGLWD